MTLRFNYCADSQAWDELLTPTGGYRPHVAPLLRFLDTLEEQDLAERCRAVDATVRTLGVTFTVYEAGQNLDRAWPLDPIPRIMALAEWRRTEAGLIQRLRALNHFIADIYDEQRIIADGVFPAQILAGSRNFRPQCVGAKPPFGAWASICGTDLVRHRDGRLYVLEDNLRVPSGVSYMLENRHVMKRIFPEAFEHQHIMPVDNYPDRLLETLCDLAPEGIDDPEVVVLTPGIYNSAYFEHCYLAQQMGAELVQGSDLVVKEDRVYMRTIEGLSPVHVIYRRIDDDFLDPAVFRADSLLGVNGLMRAWRAGNVAIANAPGAGVADDKVVYAFVPKFIEYYLAEKPMLPNVETYLCFEPDQRAYVLDHLNELVVKPANEAGGYGMLVGPQASRNECRRFADLIRAQPRNYVAQPVLTLSTVPTFAGDCLEPRHVDLRPFILQAKRPYVTLGGLCRVALRAGSLVVNSSQGGGSKDTWVVDGGQ